MESAVMTSALMSSQSAVGYQQIKRSEIVKRRRAEESADGLALMTSSVTSSQSADGLNPAVARYQQIQQMLFVLRSSSRKIPAGSICFIPAGQPDASNSSIHSRAYMNQLLLYIQSQATVDPVASFSVIVYPVDLVPRRKKRRSSEAWHPGAKISSRCDGSAVKQLTIYEETHLNGKNFVSNGINLNRSFICEESAIEEAILRNCEAEAVRVVVAQKRKSIVDNNRGKMNLNHTVEAGVHLRSLGVLTAAGCGIGSVHQVVRSNLLVDPSEVEEGEM
ncbi:putative S-adenosylmethionine-dependent methyltransferase-like [Dorcoceras hygrometricum]|uniref:Putative S-adenosylmethionine-dependent methyltransferase-like n=1 Tax=Dorcoceras hygrometricum TaxID=472368 RepID=A0A2Z7BKF3_9LAMI|nr:putative S-adenosylmethionine-dependent methyltransferase-like [Dorcoceras hygrometricum]